MTAAAEPEEGSLVIVFGNGSKSTIVRSSGVKRCSSCNANQPHNVVCRYDIFHIYWLFAHTTKKTYRDECSVCQRGADLNTAAVEKSLTQPAIPPMDRFGLPIFIGGVLFILMVIMVATKGCQ